MVDINNQEVKTSSKNFPKIRTINRGGNGKVKMQDSLNKQEVFLIGLHRRTIIRLVRVPPNLVRVFLNKIKEASNHKDMFLGLNNPKIKQTNISLDLNHLRLKHLQQEDYLAASDSDLV